MAISLILPRAGLSPIFTGSSIRWRSVERGMVEIEVDLENPDSGSTEPGELVIETAGLGAFVPFRPVTRVALGSLEPGERRQVRTRVRRESLAAPAAVPRNFGEAMAEAFRNIGARPEVLDLLGQADWAGNLNVYFDRSPERAVEVHRALGLRVRAGTAVAVMVDLPSDRQAYEIALRVPGAEWKAEVVFSFMPINLVVIRPPSIPGLRGSVRVEVTRRSDGVMVPVELALETVDGPGETLGCVRVGI
jgi:hypothetical protein